MFLPGPLLSTRTIQWVEEYAAGRAFFLTVTIYLNEGEKHILPPIVSEEPWKDVLTKKLRETPGITKVLLIIDRSLCRVCKTRNCVCTCLFCTRSILEGDHSQCCVTFYTCETCNQHFTTAARRRGHSCGVVRLQSSAIEGYFRIYDIVMPGLPSPDFFNILMDAKNRLSDLMRQLLDEFGALKFYLSIQMEFMKVVGDETQTYHFTTCNAELLESCVIEEKVMRHLLDLVQRVDEFISLGSGWIVSSLNSVKLNVTPYTLQQAGNYIETPEDLKGKAKCLLNIKNPFDHLCFLWSVIADDHRTETSNPSRQSFYQRFMGEFDVSGMKFPMTVQDITEFEDRNGRGVNVIGWKKKYGFFTERRCVGDKFSKITNLLRITDDNLNFHYILITNLPRLLCTAKNTALHHVCLSCHTLKGSKHALEEHEKVCGTKGLQTVQFPKEHYLEFNGFRKTVAMPVWVILDLESVLSPEEGTMGDKTDVLAEHHACSYALKVCSDDYPDWDLPVEYYDGPHCAEYLIKRLEEIYESLKPIIFSNEKMTSLTAVEERYHETAEKCHICLKPFYPEDVRVRDHCHYPLKPGQTSNYIGPAHSVCNQQRKTEKRLTVIAHNLSSYDLHLFIKELCEDNRDVLEKVKLLPKNLEKYISVKTPNLRFIDSYRHLNGSLDALVRDLDGPHAFRNVREHVFSTLQGNDQDVALLSRKGIFCYSYLESRERLFDPIPDRDEFHNDLTNTDVSDDEWEHLQTLIRRFNLVTVQDLLRLYNILDVLLTADVWSGYRKWCLQNTGLEPGHYVSGPAFSWDAALKMTRPRLQYLKDIDMHLMVEQGIRGGISNVIKRYATSNNPYVPDYDPSEPETYIQFFDAVNLYGFAQMGKLPYDDFKWEVVKEDSLQRMLSRNPDGDRGFILEVDVVIPAEFHDDLNQYPIFPEKMEITERDISPYSAGIREVRGMSNQFKTTKLAPNLRDKHCYVVALANLQFYVSMGGKVTKIRKILSFNQKAWLKKWADFHTEQRRTASSKIKKLFHKNAINFIFGKSMESVRKYRNVTLIGQVDQHFRQVSKEGFMQFNIIADDLVAVELSRPTVTLNKPIYTGFQILESSKLHVFKFFYTVLKRKFPEIELLLTDTDSVLVKFESKDFVGDMKEIGDHFDFSKNPPEHPLYNLANEGVPGKFKDETLGQQITSYVGLRTKLYSILMVDRQGGKRRKVAGSGIKKHVLDRVVTHDRYLECLNGDENGVIRQKTFRTRGHRIFTIETERVAGSCYDDKRYVFQNKNMSSLAHGHYSIR